MSSLAGLGVVIYRCIHGSGGCRTWYSYKLTYTSSDLCFDNGDNTYLCFGKKSLLQCLPHILQGTSAFVPELCSKKLGK